MPNMYIIWDKNPDYPLPKIDNFTEILNKHWNLDNLYEDNGFEKEIFANQPHWPKPPFPELWNRNISWNKPWTRWNNNFNMR